MRKITPITIRTYILDKKIKGSKFIRWNKREWEILQSYASIFSCEIKSGDTFLGVKHFKSKV